MTFEQELATERELQSLRSQLAECQRELDAEKYMTEHVNMPRLRAAQQQLQQMKEALKLKIARDNGIPRTEVTDSDVDSWVSAARALLMSGKE